MDLAEGLGQVRDTRRRRGIHADGDDAVQAGGCGIAGSKATERVEPLAPEANLTPVAGVRGGAGTGGFRDDGQEDRGDGDVALDDLPERIARLEFALVEPERDPRFFEPFREALDGGEVRAGVADEDAARLGVIWRRSGRFPSAMQLGNELDGGRSGTKLGFLPIALEEKAQTRIRLRIRVGDVFRGVVFLVGERFVLEQAQEKAGEPVGEPGAEHEEVMILERIEEELRAVLGVVERGGEFEQRLVADSRGVRGAGAFAEKPIDDGGVPRCGTVEIHALQVRARQVGEPLPREQAAGGDRVDVIGEERVGCGRDEQFEGVDFHELAERLGHGRGRAQVREQFMRATEKSLARLGIDQADDAGDVCAVRRQGVAAFIQCTVRARLSGQQVRHDVHKRCAAALMLDDEQFAADDGDDAVRANAAEKDVPKTLGRGGAADGIWHRKDLFS